MAKGVIDIALIYSFLKRLVTPFERWDAYKVGMIDKDGKVIVPKEQRTPEQSKSWGYFDRLVANLKKLLAKVPFGKSRIASFAAALLLLKEKNLDPDNLVELQEKLEFYMSEVDLLVEESPTMSAGNGSVAGIGIGPDGEPGIQRRKRKTKMLTRKYIEVNGKRKAFSREYTL